MYIVDKMVNGERVRLGEFADIQKASNAIDGDARIHRADIVYYVERVG